MVMWNSHRKATSAWNADVALRWELSVHLSVRPSVKHVNCDKTEEISVQIFIPYVIVRSFSLIFWEEKWLARGDPFYMTFGSTGTRWSEITNFEPIFACSAPAVTPSERSSINTNRKSATRFPMSLRWSSYVATKSPKGAQKCKMAFFHLKSHFAWRKSATKFPCVKTISDKMVRHSLA